MPLHIKEARGDGRQGQLYCFARGSVRVKTFKWNLILRMMQISNFDKNLSSTCTYRLAQ